MDVNLSELRELVMDRASPGDLLDPVIECLSFSSPAWAGKFFTTEPPGKPIKPRLAVFCLLYKIASQSTERKHMPLSELVNQKVLLVLFR